MLISPEVLTIYILDILFTLFASVAFVISLKIVKAYDANATTALQYELEKKSYLASTIIKYLFFIKVPFFLFFIFTLDSISFVLPGAMCGAGVVNASSEATPLLFLKLLNIYLFAYWIVLDKEDMSIESQPYMKQKFFLYLLFYLLLILEMVLEFSMFLNLDVKSVVDCCGAIFSYSDGSYMALVLSLPHSLIVSSFYGVYLLLFLSYFLNNRYLFAFFSLIFIPLSLVSLISFFGTYIYELPTHHCPFCFLQHDYNYIGYLLYSLLFLGTFNGVVVGMHHFSDRIEKQKMTLCVVFISIYLFSVTMYVVSFYYRNSVLL